MPLEHRAADRFKMNHRNLPYHADTLALFARLRALPHAALLHSSDRRTATGRYDIMTADPLRCVSYDQGVLSIGAKRTATKQPFAALREEFQVDDEASSPHFRTGFIGYFAYALQHTLERLPTGPPDTTGLPMLCGGDYGWSVVTDHVAATTTLWYRADLPASDVKRIERLLATSAADVPHEFFIDARYVSTTDDATYREGFNAIKTYIASGDCYQVNLARHYVAGMSGDQATASWSAYQRLVAIQPAPFGAYLATPFGHIVCLSPERFIRYSGDRIETSPIKGTAPRHTTQALDIASRDRLVDSAKDRAENLMIVDLLRNDLGRICKPGSIRAAALFQVESFANVHHLVSTICGVPRPGIDAWAALAATFPGGSVTGAPKIRAMQIINEFETVGRSVYCGSIGYIDRSGAMDTNIAIRTLAFTPSGVHCWGGGGVVADSVVSLELTEIEQKIGRLLHATAGLGTNRSCSA